MSTSKLQFETRDHFRDNPDGSVAVYIEPTGITVFGDSRSEALRHAREAVMFFMETINERDGFDGLRRYLDFHKIDYTVINQPPELSRVMELAVVTNE